MSATIHEAEHEFRPSLNEVVVQNQELLEVLKRNRKQHLKDYEEAVKLRKERAIKAFQDALKKAREGEIQTIFDLPKPENHEKDYNQAIRALEMSIHDNVHLRDQEFARYVMDEWGWKQRFSDTTALYNLGN